MESYFKKTPWQDRQIYIERSALFHLEKVRTPTLIQHGMEDVRVPLSQGEELYIGLKKNNVPVVFEKYPREPHGLREPKHQRYACRQILDWFNRWIKNKMK
jgi:dipeptidyl aminopeptidase/acylaminoacyl peptidase